MEGSTSNRPQKIFISRVGTDPEHERLQRAPGLLMFVPATGDRLRIFLDSGKLMQTSPVTRVANDGSDLVVETRNSRYRVQRAA